MEVDQSKKPRWLRFSFATMLFLIACLCGFMGGYRSGYFAGDRAWKYNQVYPISYTVADLVATSNAPGSVQVSEPDLENLVLAINDATSDMKGLCDVRPIKTNLSLIVSSNQVGHLRIAKMLNELRQSGPNAAVEEAETRGFAGKQQEARRINTMTGQLIPTSSDAE
jgi:hypothetical protein